MRILKSLILIGFLIILSKICTGFPQRLEGWYSFSYTSRESRRSTPWNVAHDWESQNRLEVKHLSWPINGVETFFSIVAESASHSTRFMFNQAHLRFYAIKDTETVFFMRQDRYWIDSPLLFLVNPDRLKDDSYGLKAEGFRSDFWNKYGFYGTIIASKYRTWDGEAYIGRLGRDFKIFNTAFLYLRKDWRGAPSETYNDVFSGWLRSSILGADLTVEGAISRHFTQTGRDAKDTSAFEVELRNIQIGRFVSKISYFDYGKDFRDELSNKFNVNNDHEFDRNGVFTEIVYFFPDLAITGVYKGKYFKSTYKHPEFRDEPFEVWWNYGELYIEFINDMYAKTYFEAYKEEKDLWKHWFLELIAENSVVRIKFQYKIKDIGVNVEGDEIDYSIGQRSIWGVELKINLYPGLQFYSRMAIGQGRINQWSSLFAQLAYRGFQNSEIFLEYGNPDHTNDDLVNDSDVADNSGQKIEERVKLYVSFWF